MLTLEMQECPRGAPWRKAPERTRSIPCAKAARCARAAIAPTHVEHVEHVEHVDRRSLEDSEREVVDAARVCVNSFFKRSVNTL